MNRKQRRATIKHGSSASATSSGSGEQIRQFLLEAVAHERARKFDDAVRAYKRVLAIDASHAEACNNLGRVLQAQGKTKDASACYARSLALMPQLLEQYAEICATLFSLRPELPEALRRQAAAWPHRLTLNDLFGDRLDAVSADPLFLCLLQSTPVRDIVFERLLTAIRHSLLKVAAAGSRDSRPRTSLTCALAKQCFINEYVFAVTPQESGELSLVSDVIADALASGAAIDPMQLAALAMYMPLHAVPSAAALLEREWTPAIDDLLNQQIRDHMREQELRDSVLRLTPIEDEVSQRVRQQYEENPYPRWVHAAGQVVPASIDRYLREQFPTGAFTPLDKTEHLDVLAAGCGTGQIAIASAQKYLGARVLALDLSLASLCYAKRGTPEDVALRIEYAQADILKLATLERSFDVIDCSGVLHHMADPFEGWRTLLNLLRPRGLMHIGLYSEAGRRDVWAARKHIAERGFGATPDEIRRCRQELLETPLATVTRFTDFFTTSECRDLLFHVQEARLNIPMLKAFITSHKLKFLGFEFSLPVLQQYRSQFTSSGWAWTDLDRWHAFEVEKPDTFSGMYQFWVQKP
ncbi:MAG TPA: methyltransferase domain-containing protein [Pseudolabrys sp.]|nr:methyltransferase domain-containing protein [Pseudolabrys sp.]